MPKNTDTRARVLRTAATLFQTQGYHGTGLNQVLAEAAAPKGSLYFHFPGGKEQLATEAVTQAGGELCRLIETTLADARDPADAVEKVFGALGHVLAESDYTLGCPVAAVALESADTTALRSACGDVYGSWIDVVATFLTRHGLAADAARSTATVTVAAIEGALLLSRTQRDLAPLHAVADHVRDSIAATTGGTR
ncbi:MAG TPA: TetR/AcrR family transcriptional regulator [Actinocatenispora sp.]